MEIPEGLMIQASFFLLTAGGIVTGLKMFGGELAKHGEKLDELSTSLTDFKLSMEKRLGVLDTAMATFQGSLDSHDERGRSLKDKVEQLSRDLKR